jgi:hypothetical protein
MQTARSRKLRAVELSENYLLEIALSKEAVIGPLKIRQKKEGC